MLTYELKKAPGVPLYEALYRAIRGDILSGSLAAGEKLPSKRALAENLEVSKITVETAYSQLLAEGYITAREKVGYFVEDIPHRHPAVPGAAAPVEIKGPSLVDLTANGSARFPFSAWSRLQREVMLDYGEKLLLPMPNRGIPELRQAISDHLAAFRGMKIHPEQILIGAGTDFLYNILVQLLGRDKVYALEEPGYDKTRRIYTAAGARCVSAPMDEQGVMQEVESGVAMLALRGGGEVAGAAALLRALSAPQHMRDFAAGILDTRTLVFHLSAAALLLFASVRLLEARRLR